MNYGYCPNGGGEFRRRATSWVRLPVGFWGYGEAAIASQLNVS
ncbi:MAG TPA: hypothetical protein V6C84_27995 [Coleofasciculaceae cyanobacterium]